MTWNKPTPFERLELGFICDYCHQQPGEWCRTRSNQRSQFLHGSRFHRAVEIQRNRLAAVARRNEK